MNIRPIALGVILAVQLAAVPGWSRPPPPEPFKSYDPDDKGRVSLRKWQEYDWRIALKEFDADGDGRISAAEHIAERCEVARQAAWCLEGARMEFELIDRNHNGFLDREENDVISRNLFRFNDLNNDGFVTAAELQAAARRH